jgi:hypothetical protein
VEYTNKILIGFKNGREIELDTDFSPDELYGMADSQGFINQTTVVFQLADVSYIIETVTGNIE